MGDVRAVPRPPTDCPSCGDPIARGLSICPHCGAVIGLEEAAHTVSSRIQDHIFTLTKMLAPKRWNRTLVLWVVAAMPMVIGPAVIAVLYILVQLSTSQRRAKLSPKERRLFPVILVVALINVIASILLWDAFGLFLAEQLRFFIDHWIRPDDQRLLREA